MAKWHLVGNPEYKIGKSIPDAKASCEKAAESGHAEARCDLARFYIDKKHGGHCKKEEMDLEKAIKIMELVGHEGYGEAFYKLEV